MVSVPGSTPPPAASPQKPGNARGAPVHIHVSVPEAPKVQTINFASQSTAVSRTTTPTATPSKQAPAAVADGATTPPAAHGSAVRLPPSSSKRMLAPNGQPRKIPMAMDFDQGEQGHGGALPGQESSS